MRDALTLLNDCFPSYRYTVHFKCGFEKYNGLSGMGIHRNYKIFVIKHLLNRNLINMQIQYVGVY